MAAFIDLLNETSGSVFPIGIDDHGELLKSNLESMPHLLVSGAAGTGKSVFLHNLLLSLIAHNSSEQLQLILCDTKIAELSIYNNIPHLLCPVCIDNGSIASMLNWAATETYQRLNLLNTTNTRSFADYNDYAWENFISDSGLPRILVVVDDLTSVVSSDKDSVESIQKIIQNGRLVGIHLIVVTQTPLWGLSKGISLQFREKIVFSAATKSESNILLGTQAAFGLSSCGVAIFSEGGKQIHKVSISMPQDRDFSIILDPIKVAGNAEPKIAENHVTITDFSEDTDEQEGDVLLPLAVDAVLETTQASVSMIQRKLKLGYAHAARLMDEMEERGIVGGFNGSQPRQLLITKEQWRRMREKTYTQDSENTDYFDNSIQHENNSVSVKESGVNNVTESYSKRIKNCLHRIFFGGARME